MDIATPSSLDFPETQFLIFKAGSPKLREIHFDIRFFYHPFEGKWQDEGVFLERLKWLFDKEGTGDVRLIVESTAVRSEKVWDLFGPWGLLQAELQWSRETYVLGTQETQEDVPVTQEYVPVTQERRSRGSVWETIKGIFSK